MASDKILHSVIAEAGYDATSIIAQANSPETKEDLRARTKEAKDTGICGVPSYRVFRRRIGHEDQEWKSTSDIIWGQDETTVVEDLISGWDGQSIASEVGGPARPQNGSTRL
jgi:2-hydroxychromene-2-carboxylate isomerase